MQKERAGYSKRMTLFRWTPGGEPLPSVLPPRSAGTREPPHTGFRAGSTSARTSERAGHFRPAPRGRPTSGAVWGVEL